VLRIALVIFVLSFCSSCQSVGEYLFRPRYDYAVIYYNQNSYDLENVGFSAGGKPRFGAGWLDSNQLKTGSFISNPLTRDVVCEWEKAGQSHKKQFHLPPAVEKKFQGTIVFFFTNDDVTMEYEMYSDRIERGPLAHKYQQMPSEKSR